MKNTAAPSKNVPIMTQEEIGHLDISTRSILEMLRLHGFHKEAFEPHMVFRYMVDCAHRDENGTGNSVMDQNLMFFGLEACKPHVSDDEKDIYYYSSARQIVEHLSRGECIYPGAGCEVRMFVPNGYDNLKVIATLLNGWTHWQYEIKNNCTYEELIWTIKELGTLKMLPEGA